MMSDNLNDKISPNNLALLATTLGISLSQDLNDIDLSTLINLLGLTVNVMNSILVQREVNQGNIVDSLP